MEAMVCCAHLLPYCLESAQPHLLPSPSWLIYNALLLLIPHRISMAPRGGELKS